MKYTRTKNLGWSEPFLKTVCPSCNKEIVKKYNLRWYYSLNSLLILIFYFYSIFFYQYDKSSTIVKVFIVSLSVVAVLVLIKQSFDYRYISVTEEKNQKETQKRKNTKGLIKHAKKHLQNPVHVDEYMNKHQLTYAEVKVLINSGELSAWGGTEEDSVFIDET